MTYSLKFDFTPANSDNLKIGILSLFKNGVSVNAIRVTSSVAGRQYWESWIRKGGLIPPGEWQVATSPINMPHISGVATGNKKIPSFFYQIFPEIQTQKNGVIRGDFGIHFDGNTPGSLGCIVAPTELGWLRICEFMAEAKKTGAERIPLSVHYHS